MAPTLPRSEIVRLTTAAEAGMPVDKLLACSVRKHAGVGYLVTVDGMLVGRAHRVVDNNRVIFWPVDPDTVDLQRAEVVYPATESNELPLEVLNNEHPLGGVSAIVNGLAVLLLLLGFVLLMACVIVS